jgi:hypothetical protein
VLASEDAIGDEFQEGTGDSIAPGSVSNDDEEVRLQFGHDFALGSRIHSSTTLLEAQKDGAEHELVVDDKGGKLLKKIYGIHFRVGAGAGYEDLLSSCPTQKFFTCSRKMVHIVRLAIEERSCFDAVVSSE